MTANQALPIDAIRQDVLATPAGGRLVLSSPTGSGKSTQVPRWFRSLGKVLVVEPRRVACRSLAARVAELDGHSVGQETGYIVRDERRSSSNTTVTFATPGVVLRFLREKKHREYATIIIDEFHERSLDTDLLLALLREETELRLIVMSATLDGDRIAEHLGGIHLHAPGRTYPVDIHHIGERNDPPSSRNLENRVLAAVDQAEKATGDILIFLPGKAEIAAVCSALDRRGKGMVLPLHGHLSLEEQSRIFRPSKKRKIIVSTNVAETSLTVPGIGVVIDSGLVRQTRYYQGRGFLSLVAIASDSASQRAGRAGRTGPGQCFRLWSKAARMEERTRPEIHRESLVPLVIASAACGRSVDSLNFLTPPKEYAIAQAREELNALGALDGLAELTPTGQELFKLPMDPGLGRLLIEAVQTPSAEDMIDLVAGLSVGRNLFGRGKPEQEDDDLRSEGSDALAWIRAVRYGQARKHGLDAFAIGEARRTANRLRSAFGKPKIQGEKQPDMDALAQLILKADPRTAHVARPRGKWIGWSNGGTEIELGTECTLDTEKWKAVAVLSSRALKTDKGDTRVLATCVLPLPFPWMVRAGLGRDRVHQTEFKRGKLEVLVERIYAKKVIGKRTESPTGELAREAVLALLERGSLFRKVIQNSRIRFDRWKLAEALQEKGLENFGITPLPDSDFAHWLSRKVHSLGIESGEDLELLSDSDFEIPELDSWTLEQLDRSYPYEVKAGDGIFEVQYDLPRRKVRLVKRSGKKNELPPLSYLPRFQGFGIEVEDRGKVRQLRGRQ